jgi:pyruvate/2-oxoglutarate dehydrogenase complex dihydrolipoamide dehydrogenase (E3) component
MMYDNIIIGFGQGPKVLANTMRQHNESVLSIEADRLRYGGTCFTVGCIPTKELIFKSQHRNKGLTAQENYKQAILGKIRTVEMLRDVGYHMIADSGAHIINGVGSFIDNHHVKVESDDGKSQIFEGKRIIINTGSTPIIPDIPGINDSHHVFDSTGLMDQKILPDRLVIIGAGAIGLEFATMFNNFGSHVTLIEANDTFMPAYDSETAQAVYEDLTDEGIRIFKHTKVLEITDHEDFTRLSMQVNGNEPLDIDTDAILVATGRRPNIDRLNLDATDIQVDGERIIYDEHLETTVKNVFVEGDVKGGPQLTSISLSDNRVISNHLYGDNQLNVNHEQEFFPTSIFMNVPLSHIGLTAKEAEKQGYDVLTSFLPASGTLRSNITGDERGFMKIVVDSKSEEILGATFYIDQSPEIINLVALTMHEHLKYKVLTSMTYTHPVASEMLFFLLSGLQ